MMFNEQLLPTRIATSEQFEKLSQSYNLHCIINDGFISCVMIMLQCSRFWPCVTQYTRALRVTENREAIILKTNGTRLGIGSGVRVGRNKNYYRNTFPQLRVTYTCLIHTRFRCLGARRHRYGDAYTPHRLCC